MKLLECNANAYSGGRKCMEYINEVTRLRFLLYSYFGVDIKERYGDEGYMRIKKSCSERAYRDMARTIEFEYSSTGLKDLDKEKKDAYQERKGKAKNDVNEYIAVIADKFIDDKMINIDKTSDIDGKWHEEACGEIIVIFNKYKVIKNKKSLTHGQAQKWLNMALKNMWLLGLIKDGKEKYLHIPIDNYIISAACTCEENPYFLGVDFTFTKNNKDSWSSWNDYNEYLKFQEEIRNAIAGKKFNIDGKEVQFQTPIQWENEAWIEQAKIEAGK
ncbi:MAG: hypothetical protein NC393_09980 [Clostridium sp.]|nr:hypothetical protein [Clostridium sp.]MCM1172442.1 hypothetical protein [Clostridium sp.]